MPYNFWMGIDQAELIQWFTAYAYEPMIVYSAIVVLLTASSFGLPVPEEVTLISVGLIAYMGLHPEQFPPPHADAKPVSLYGLMTVTFLSVFLSDLLVFLIGKYGGDYLRNKPRFAKYVTSAAMIKVEAWTKKYGAIMCGVFRFTPGLRFPGHMMCGMLGVPTWKFVLVDGTAALLTVPTQVWVVAIYGEVILEYFKQVKIVLLVVLAIGILLFFARKSSFVQRALSR